jgi:hypothetical protein
VEIESSTSLPENTARLLNDVTEAFDDLLRARTDMVRKLRDGAKKILRINFVWTIMTIAEMAGITVLLFAISFSISLLFKYLKILA